MLAVIVVSPLTVYSATITYSGRVTSEFGDPIEGGLVIVGTFDPAFDPAGGEGPGFLYACMYGDSVCNLEDGAYDAAVADGNFIPFANIGPDTLTDENGFFPGKQQPQSRQDSLFGCLHLQILSLIQVRRF